MDQNHNDHDSPLLRDDSPDENQTFVVQKVKTEAKSATASTPTTEPALSIVLQGLTDKALEFLSNASNETLGACIAGLGATTYFILGRVGLIIIGLVGGVTLHATWENNGQRAGDEQAKATELRRRREVGLEVVNRILHWRQTESKPQEQNALVDSKATPGAPGNRDLDFGGFPPSTKAALTGLTDAVVRDYVK